ncbi:hypothetical protein K1T71_003508 [Dendrolimus kikuchii]|uniref:Uncharacterized protein n=1 Tax=Dendrolimus kikuchii TaxID=765133 RepID=A0ACC1DCT2_9NEOP|nr:hypothetical protein K1T71_003508 [Dendrolimus kikuchii]
MEPETLKDNIKMEPELHFNDYNVFGMETNVVSEYYQNPYITEDNMMTKSEYNTDSETTYTEIGMMDKTSNNKQHDEVWSHFEKVDDDCAVCKYCHKMFAYKSLSSNLSAHLKRAHLTVYNDQWPISTEPVASTSKDYPATKVQLDIKSVQPENPKKPALAWDHFFRVDQSHAVCKYCRKKLSYKTTTGNLNAHMRRVHKPILIKYLKTLEKDSSSIEEQLELKASLNNDDETTFDSCSKFGVIWKYFDKLGEEYAMCKECYKELSCKTTTGNLGTHLKRSHPTLYSQYRSITDRDPNKSTVIDIGEDVTLPVPLLNHFEKIGKYTVMCKYCSRKLPLSTTSGSLSRHLRITHPEVYLEYKTSKRETFASSLQNDSGILSDSGDNSETERDDERILFDEWKKKGGVWAHYIQDKNRCAICKYCQKSISYKATTGNLGSHLRRAHKPLYMNKKSDKTETVTVSMSSTTTVSEDEMHISETVNHTHIAKVTTVNVMELKQSTNTLTNETGQSDKSDKICDSSADEVSVKSTHKFDEVLIKLENPVNNKSITKPYMNSDSLEISETKPKSNTHNKVLNDTMQTEDPKISLDIAKNNISTNVEQNIKQYDKETIIDLEEIEDIPLDNIIVPDLGGNITPNDVNELLAETSTNSEESNSLLKLKKLDLIWKYFQKVDKKSCKCKTCQQIFISHKEAPLTIHLKGKHPSVYKKFLGSYRMHEYMHIQFLYQHYKREGSVIAQCKYCNVVCKWTLRHLIKHLGKHHPRLYMEYNSIKKNEKRRIALAKLKKNAVPSVFLKEVHPASMATSGFKKQNNILEANNMAVPQIENTPELAATENNAGISQNAEAEVKTECRACLKNCDVSVGLYDLFQPWFLPWDGMDSTVAADLAKIAKIQVSPSDIHSKFICHSCCVKLRDACEFTASVKRSDQILRFRCMQTGGLPTDTWPKPIKLDMSVDTTVMEVDIKQEIVSEHECDNESMENNEFNPSNSDFEPMDIKVEPEEIVVQNPSDVIVNGIQAEEFAPHNSGGNNSDENTQDNLLNMMIKEEPLSEEEEHENLETLPDLPLECMLCSKVFHEITGLKAHVIAQHSYKTVRRKTDDDSPVVKHLNERYVCDICKRVCHTSTDLMVHETCHNKCKCFECNEKFETFADLMNHRNSCKVIQSKGMQKLKTLDDVRRPYVDSPTAEAPSEPTYPMLRVKSSEELGSMSLHFQIHSVRSVADQEMKTEALDTSFSEDDTSFNNCYT